MPLLPRLLGFFGLQRKAYSVPSVPGNAGGWFPLIREGFPGAWQRNITLDARAALTFHADFACKTLISRDIAKLPVRLVERDSAGIWNETKNTAFSPVLRKPNHYQTRNQFWESWILSKLYRGNTYVLKEYDARRVVKALHVLNPDRVQVLEADDGSVFYRLSTDHLNGVDTDITVPATEIIHDRFNCMFHPLVGVPPIFASCLAAMQGLNIQNYSAALYANASQPGGILSAPGNISDADVTRLETKWAEKHAGPNIGKLAVLGSGLKYEKLSLTAVEGQLIEQLKLTGEIVCTTYHVPPFMVGIGPEPTGGNAQERTLRYYTQCLQSLVEDAEACLDEGLGLGEQYDLGVEFDIDNLLRMDTATQADVATKLVKGGIYTPNDGRRRFNLAGLTGGNTVFMQQQDVPLAVAASVKEHPLNKEAAPAPVADPPPPGDDMDDDDLEKAAALELRKSLGLPLAA